MKKALVIALLAVSLLLPSMFIVSVKAGIPVSREDEDEGPHQTWAWAKISAIWNIFTRRYYGHSHDHDWDYWGPYYYDVWLGWSLSPYYPYAWTKVYYSPDDIWYYLDAYAYAQLNPL